MATTKKTRAGKRGAAKAPKSKKATKPKKAKKATAKKATAKKPATRKATKKKPVTKQPPKKAKAAAKGKAVRPKKQAAKPRKTARPAPPPTVRRRATPVSDYWRKLKECGWLEQIPEAEHPGLLERLSAALAQNPVIAFQSLAVTSLDPECIEGSGPEEVCSYHSVLKQLADASFGRFQPEEILDELDLGLQVARISFCIGDLSFHCEVPCKDDWVQPGLFKLVNSALEASGVAQRFLPLPSDSQQMHLAFVPDAVLACARQAGLIPKEDLIVPLSATTSESAAAAPPAQG